MSQSALAQTTSDWLGGSGNWFSTPCAHWSTCTPLDGTPDGNYDVFITVANSSVNLTGTVSVVNLTIGSSDTLTIAGSGLSTTAGTISNSGTITLTKATDSIGGSSGGMLVNQGTMQGQGGIGLGTMPITNHGTINANVSGGTLTIQPNSGGLTNTGTMEASNGGKLFLQSGLPVGYNNTGGTIQALNGSTVGLFADTITGGTLTTVGTGVIQTFGGGANPILNNLTNAGNFQILSGGGAALEGTINNTGTIQVLSTGGGTDLFVNGIATLKGGGVVTMSDEPTNFISSLSAGSNQLINQSTIQGAGAIGDSSLALTNQGTIDANAITNHLLLTGLPATNTALMEASGGGTLEIRNTVNNTDGTIQALNGSNVLISGTVRGGTLTTSGSGTFQTSSGTLDGTANPVTNAGSFVVSGGNQLSILGTIKNTGTIAVTGLGSGVAVGAGTATLAGTGSLSLSNNGVITGAPGSTLLNQSLIQGSGTIGINGVVSLNNQGTVNANAPSTTLFLAAGTVANTANVEASNGGTLQITRNTVNNTGGTIEALNASTVQLNGTTINGGTLTTSGTGVIETNNIASSATLNGVTNAGVYEVLGGSATTLAGTINNLGTISMSANPSSDILDISGNVTLQGKGKLTLSNSPNNLIQGASTGNEILTNQGTIQGSGNIGEQFMGLVNGSNGLIVANQITPLIIDPDSKGFSNLGTLQVNSGATMRITGPLNSFTNLSGTTLTGGTYNVSGTLEFDSGNIVTNAANITLAGPSAQFINGSNVNDLASFATNAAKASFTLSGGAKFTTAGAFTNNGSLTIGAGSTFKVNGNLTNFSGPTLTGGTYNVAGALQFNNANIVTNAANITLTGTLSQIISQTSANGLANFATNGTGASFTINGGRNFTTGASFTNNGTLTVGSGSTFNSAAGNYTNTGTTSVETGGTFIGAGTLTNTGSFRDMGTLEATSGKTLDLHKGVFADSGGTILATGTGTQVLLDGATISGGTLTANSGGTFIGENSATLDGSTGSVTISAGNLQVNNAQILQAKGNIINNGAITLNSTGSATKLLLTGNTTLGGTGTLTLSNDASNLIGGSASTIALTNNGTIQGAGSIGSIATPIGLVNKMSITANQSTPLIINASASGFTNNGTLTVGAGSTLKVNGNLTNFSGTTLTGGTYNVSGTFQFPGANIVTNAANVTLTGTSAKILNSSNNANALANFATNAASGLFYLQGGGTFTSAGSFSNAGTLTIGSGSKFTVGGTGTTYTQTAGSTIDDGTLALAATGALNLNAGSLLGTGQVIGAVNSTGTITPGNSSTSTGILKETGAFTQNSGGTLAISIGGTTAGTQYDQLNPSSAHLNGALRTNLINGFVPTVGQTFMIMNFSSRTGTFTSCDGTSGGTTCPINGSEHFNIAYKGTGVVLTVASGATASINGLPAKQIGMGFGTRRSFGESTFGVLRNNVRAYTSQTGMSASELPSVGTLAGQNRLNPIVKSNPTHNLFAGIATHRFMGADGYGALHNGINPAARVLHSSGRPSRGFAHRSIEYHLDLLSILRTNPRRVLSDLAGNPGSPNAFRLGYFALQ